MYVCMGIINQSALLWKRRVFIGVHNNTIDLNSHIRYTRPSCGVAQNYTLNNAILQSLQGGRNEEGYACLHVEDIKFISRSTNFCALTGAMLNVSKTPLNYIDVCCQRQLKCDDDASSGIHGNIMTHRPCHCNTDFRKCLQRYGKIAVYKDLADAVLRAVNQLKSCQIRDGTSCNPNNPETCRKGDLIDPKYAHCRVNCKTGPLLPIGQRMCRIRQCNPPNYVEGVRVIDVPNRATSSVCEPVRNLPYVCGKGDTRCVCDGKPAGSAFSDRCRCQFWPFIF